MSNINNMSNTMNTNEICENLDNIIDKLKKINYSCKNIKEHRSYTGDYGEKNNSSCDNDDVIAAGYNGPQRNTSNAFWVGSLRNVWTRY